MCGIYGTTIKYSDNQVKLKLQRTAFRGPDQLGVEKFKTDSHNISFGHNRLSIIDLDPRSNQPFTYQSKVHIVFNGEIYNFLELKKTLQNLGYSFNTTSDTEVICAAYLEFGNDCVKHLNGMFAFVIYDIENQLMFGARDRLGQKPFYYYHNGNDFEFSSQISSIQLDNQNLSISKKAIDYYIAWGNIPDPYSIFNEIHKLKAGHRFTFNLTEGKMDIDRYWDIDYKTKPSFNGSLNQAKEELDTLLRDAVKIRLFADVPVGVFLSGGVDSSTIAALATQTSNTKIKTFSVKFNEKGFNESVYAQKVADHLKTDHTEIECNYEEGIDMIHNFSHYYDEPFADSSAIPSMLLSKYTKKKVTVALSGDAGDENFIGYHRYDWIKKGEKIMKLPYPVRKIGASILNLSPNYRMKVIANSLLYKNTNEAYVKSMTENDSALYNYGIDPLKLEENKYLNNSSKGILERVSDFDLKTYLNWDINTKVDRASMAYSLEVRAPLLDYRVVEFGRTLPTKYKFHNGVMKRILKEVLYDYVPKEIFDRPKAGFTMPFSEWFRRELKDYVLDELSETSLKDIPGLNTIEVIKRINQHMDNKWNRYPMIWKLLVLKQWLKNNSNGYTIK